METATIERTGEAAATAGEALMIETFEQQSCPRCTSAFPPGCVRGVPPTPESSTSNERTVQAWCPHCDVGFEVRVVYRDGRAVQVGAPRLVMGQSVAELRSEYDRLHGVRQRSPGPAPYSPPPSAAACARLLDAAQVTPAEEAAVRRAERVALRARLSRRRGLLQRVRDLELSMLLADVRDRSRQYELTYGAPPPADFDPGNALNVDLMMGDCDQAEPELEKFEAAYLAGEPGMGPGLAEATAAREQAAGQRTAPENGKDYDPTALHGLATPTAEQYAEAHAQERTIDTSTSQVRPDDEGEPDAADPEPGRDYME